MFNYKIEEYKKLYDNLIINFTTDYGPITKILGLYNIENLLDPKDIIIILDDDWKIKNTMSYYYNLVYQLYNCDAIFIDEKYIINWENNMELLNFNEIFYDNYQNSAYGWLSFSLKYKYIEKLYNFYMEIIKIDNSLIKHDDLIITLFYKLNKLYACGINLFLNVYERLDLENVDALKNEEGSWLFRYELEKSMYEKYNFEYTLLRKQIYIKNLNINNSEIYINQNILQRNLLYNIDNIKYNPEKNNYDKKHIDIKYFTQNIYMITITYYDNLSMDEDILYLNINNIDYELYIKFNNNFSNKKTYFIKTNIDLIKINHKNYDFNIIQTNNENKISLNKFYSINSILLYIPDINYIFYNKEDRINFINSINPVLLNIYNKLDVGAYKADFFRALYIYINGGLYLDCKNILFNNINYILEQNEGYVQDLNDGIYNGFLYCSYVKNNNFQKYIYKMIFNIFNSLYLSSCLEITGPELLKKYIKDNLVLKKCNDIYDNWKNSYLINNNNNSIIIKNSYYNYYNENNYINTNHYGILYQQRKVFNEIEIPYHKINKINLILWINLERSPNRREHMENILKNINIPNIRINAIDGNKEDINNIVNIECNKKNISKYEIACCLSHIKSVNYLNNIKGDYFMICEDDIIFNNLILINNDLNEVISNAPEFDILLINKIYYSKFNNMYEDWNLYIEKGMDFQIAGAGCYIISRSGIDKIINSATYINDENFIFNNNKKFDVSDMYLYKDLKTYCYKYNLCSTIDKESTIHNEHVIHHVKNTNFQIEEIINDIL